MIYVSSASIRKSNLTESVKELASSGFKNIELTAGNRLSDNWKQELLELKHRFNLKFLCHNYFPVPKDPFVLNLASLDGFTRQRSLDLAESAFETSRELGAERYGIHAGFRLDIPVQQIGKRIDNIPLNNDNEAWMVFIDSIRRLQKESGNIDLYIENNVLSGPNFESFGQVNPFYVVDSKSWERLKNTNSEIKLLCDVAHLKVSSKSLGLDFKSELENMISHSDYIHLSDNDGVTDSNQKITKHTDWISLLKNVNFSDSTIFTLEVYGTLEEIKSSYDIVANKIL